MLHALMILHRSLTVYAQVATSSPPAALDVLCLICNSEASQRALDMELHGVDPRARAKILSNYLSTAVLSR